MCAQRHVKLPGDGELRRAEPVASFGASWITDGVVAHDQDQHEACVPIHQREDVIPHIICHLLHAHTQEYHKPSVAI